MKHNCLGKVCPPDTRGVATLSAEDVVGEALGKIIGGVRAFEQYPGARMRSKSSLLRHMASFLVFDMLERLRARQRLVRHEERIEAPSQAKYARTL